MLNVVHPDVGYTRIGFAVRRIWAATSNRLRGESMRSPDVLVAQKQQRWTLTRGARRRLILIQSRKRIVADAKR
jgi:hypothetical protein